MNLMVRFAWNTLRAVSAAALVTSASAQTPPPGNATAGETLWNGNGCSGCHTVTKVRGDITGRAPSGMNFDKAQAALVAALNGADLDGNQTGMQGFAAGLNSTNRNDLAAYIAGLAGPAPLLRYAPASGPIFPATAAGANSSQTVTITNAGTAPLVFQTNNAVTIAIGGDAADFRVTATNCAGTTLNPNSGNCTINVTFQPAAGANLTRTASIGLATSAGNSLVPMSGSVSTGTPPAGGSAAVPPASGGGGALPATWALLLAAASLARVRRISRS
jgi:mono/diheme cytochrome c family protein